TIARTYTFLSVLPPPCRSANSPPIGGDRHHLEIEVVSELRNDQTRDEHVTRAQAAYARDRGDSGEHREPDGPPVEHQLGATGEREHDQRADERVHQQAQHPLGETAALADGGTVEPVAE